MKVITNIFNIGLPILFIFLYSNYFEFIFSNGILISQPIFYMVYLSYKQKEQEIICKKKRKLDHLKIYLNGLSKSFVV